MWSRLREEAARLEHTTLRDLVAADAARANDFALKVGPLYANFSRQRIDRAARDALFALAEQSKLQDALHRLMDGEAVNVTEGRPALHTALRGDVSEAKAAREAHSQARDALVRMRTMVAEIAASGVTDIVSVGIGGSDLGPRLVVDALSPLKPALRIHFVSNVDGEAIHRALAGLDPAKTAGILISKSFGTQETLLNGRVLREWLGDDTRLYAVSANVAKAANYGVDEARILPMWDWVGGRYSLWSAVGLPIALGIGMDRFEALLSGAGMFDVHAYSAPLRQNMAVWHALIAVWNRNALGLHAQAVLPYDDRLKLLPAYLQQLVMESLGKRVTLQGAAVAQDSVPVWWGGTGSDCQHSFFQALHQGTEIVPADFIGVVQPDHPHAENHRALLSNLLAQMEALANGQESDDVHRVYPGNRPSTLLLLDRLTPESLGMLLSLYEHSVYLQSVLWGINAFDQFGVELGKQVANKLLPVLAGETEADDPVTKALVLKLR